MEAAGLRLGRSQESSIIMGVMVPAAIDTTSLFRFGNDPAGYIDYAARDRRSRQIQNTRRRFVHGSGLVSRTASLSQWPIGGYYERTPLAEHIKGHGRPFRKAKAAHHVAGSIATRLCPRRRLHRTSFSIYVGSWHALDNHTSICASCLPGRWQDASMVARLYRQHAATGATATAAEYPRASDINTWCPYWYLVVFHKLRFAGSSSITPP